MSKIDEKELKKLFDEFKEDNKKNFEKFYLKYNKLIYGIAFSIIKNKEDAEDIVQIVFSKLYSLNKGNFPSKSEASWIYSLTKNETISFLRKQSNNINFDNIYEIQDYNNEINNVIDKIEFNSLIDKLNELERQIVSLKIISGFSFDEIGRLLKLPTGTVKWKYYKSINNLKVLLGSFGMFIITFVVGIKTLFNKDRSINQEELIVNDEILNDENLNKITQDERSDQNIEDNRSSINQEQFNDIENKSDDVEKQSITENLTIENEIIDENQNTIQNEIENTIEETKTVKNDSLNEENTNLLGIGIYGVSIIFLILTIIYLIKYQLKYNKKSSK